MTIDVAIIGGGISGLATAYSLKNKGQRVVVLERQAHPGGNAVSERIGGFLMEHGPSTVSALSDTADRFSSELGLEAARCKLGPGVANRYLVKAGRLSGIPVHPLGFLKSGYLSPMARLRMVSEILIRRRRENSDETVGEFCTRRFGKEFAERIMDPMVGGIYSGRADELSVRSVFPKLLAMEAEYGSVSLGVLLARRKGGEMPGSRLFSWTNGIGSLPRALAARLGPAVRTGVTVRRISPKLEGYRIDAGPAASFDARAVVIATQPHVAASMLENVDRVAAKAAGEIDAPPVAVVFLGFRRSDVEHPLDGLGLLAPSCEKRALLGAQFCSTMFPARAQDGHVAVAAYIGGARAPDLARLPASELIELARAEFRELIGARGEPAVARVRHWPRGLPQYRPGHEQRRQDIVELPERQPGLFITGNYIAGPSVAVCLEQAEETAERTARFLALTPKHVYTPAQVSRTG